VNAKKIIQNLCAFRILAVQTRIFAKDSTFNFPNKEYNTMTTHHLLHKKLSSPIVSPKKQTERSDPNLTSDKAAGLSLPELQTQLHTSPEGLTQVEA
jgi:hypothetical protein